jgi:hypothetical protein
MIIKMITCLKDKETFDVRYENVSLDGSFSISTFLFETFVCNKYFYSEWTIAKLHYKIEIESKCNRL